MIRQSLALSTRMQLQASPRLQQAVRLLQMSALEFSHELEEALENNPFLEMVENTERDADGEELPWRGRPGAGRGENADAGDWTCATPTLREHLQDQLWHMPLSDRERLAASVVVESLDDAGYLRDDPAETATALALEPALSPEELDAGLRTVRALDPEGVGATDLADCLSLQLEALPPTPQRELALVLVRHHLAALAQHDYAELRRLLDCGEPALHAAHALIRTLDPRPGARFGAQDPGYVVPDIIVVQEHGELSTRINPALVPRLRLNQAYVEALHQSREHGGGLSHQLQEARWLLRNAEQRLLTIKRVADAVVQRQRGFFLYGDIALKPLVLREVADQLGLHESTVSRATAHKYLAAPRGLYEFKHFFSRQLPTRSGGRCSAAAVQALLREMISSENGRAPLSDIQLTGALRAQGIQVARRTVTKYRSRMRMLPADLRRTA